MPPLYIYIYRGLHDYIKLESSPNYYTLDKNLISNNLDPK